MLVAVVQFGASTDPEANLAAFGRLAAEAVGAGAELVVLPEGSMHDFGPPELPLGPVAQHLDGSFAKGLAEVARAGGVTVVAGMFETSPDAERPFNTLLAVDPDGERLATYRKAHLYDSFGYRESDRMLAGDGQPVVLDVGGFRLGLLTCYDLRFPELARSLIDAGAEVLVVPAAWVRGPLKEDHWLTLLRARAIENTAYVVAAGQTGPRYVGRSMVIDPAGVVVAALGEQEGWVVAGVERGRLAEVRRQNPSLGNRRRIGRR